jgi:hypothetical protein
MIVMVIVHSLYMERLICYNGRGCSTILSLSSSAARVISIRR